MSNKITTANPNRNLIGGKIKSRGKFRLLETVSQCEIASGYGKQVPRTAGSNGFGARLLLIAVLSLLFAMSGSAAQLTWDPGDTNNGAIIDPGSGNWDNYATNLNWNNGSGNTNWSNTSGAVFAGADAGAGAYQVNVDGPVTATNITFNNNGYALSGSVITLAGNGSILVAPGVSATIGNNFTGNNSALYWGAMSGASLNIAGNLLSGGDQTRFYGPGAINLLGGANYATVSIILSTVTQYGGSYTATSSFQIGYPQTIGGVSYGGAAFPGTFIVDGGATVTCNGGVGVNVGRSGGVGALIVTNGTFNIGTLSSAVVHMNLPNDNTAGEHALLEVAPNGTLNVGSASGLSGISMLSYGCTASETSILNQSGGTINVYGGIEFGGTATYTGGFAALTNTGGFLYLGAAGIALGTTYPATNIISLSGGTLGALANWSSTMPMTLSGQAGNVTFQTADSGGNAHNITLSGALTGPGGLFVTGGGILKLSGANNYNGSTVVSNGTLVVATGGAPTAGSLTLDGSGSGTAPIYSVDILNTGQCTTNNGDLTYAAGTLTADFNYGAYAPSTAVAPMQVSGNVNFQVAPVVTIEGSAIPAGIYPLISYGNSVINAGNLPAVPASLPASTTAYLSNSVTAKTIYLVVSSSPVTAGLKWAVGSGIWDINTSPNWEQLGVLVKYTEPNEVVFDDTATGPFPITITNNSTVSPVNVTVSTTNSYIFTGNGTIAGNGSLTMVAAGTLTMSGTNTYSGGTLIASGQININYGGDGVMNSAIGTGPLTNDLGSKVDNTSGHPVTLLTPIAQYWNDDWTFIGSADYNTGPGVVTLGNNNVILTVLTNTLEVDGAIGDNGQNDKLTKQGNGSLTLAGNSTFGGGLELIAGQLNLANGDALGSGICTIDSGILDNYSGGQLEMYPASYVWNGSFTFLGTSNNLDLGPGDAIVKNSLTVNIVSNTFLTEGDIIPGNEIVTKAGAGTWDITGYGTPSENMNLTVDQGTVLLDKLSGPVVNGAISGLLVQSNALVLETDVTGGAQIAYGQNHNPVAVTGGGILDLNGASETVDSFNSTNGILRNSAIGGTSTLKVGYAGNVMTLSGDDCGFDVTDPNGVLNISAIVAGSGSLVKTGSGMLNLEDTNTYTGNLTVDAGTLEMNAPGLTNTATVTISNAAVLDLNFVNNDTNQIGSLVLNGISQPAGLYNASTTPAYITGSGSLLVVPPPPTVNPLPGPIQFSFANNSLTLSWPTNSGWILQSQTNTLNVGLNVSGSSWFDVVGSGSVTSTNIVVNPTNPAVFFRLRHP